MTPPPPGAADDRSVAGGDPDEAARHRAGRTAAARAHADALEQRRRQETARARSLIADLVTRASADGPAPAPLRALDPDGRRSYRTPLRGWYLRRDRRVAVGTDGEYYVLVLPSGLLGMLTGVRPTPTDPPLVIGAGGRDGESVDLADAIARVLSGPGPGSPG